MARSQLQFPRLLYVGDVPVDATVGGSAFVYRLLERYPTDRLRVVEGSIWQSVPDKRLPDVTYETLRLGSRRVLHTRFGRQYAPYLLFKAGLISHRLDRTIKDFQPEAILSVAHGFLWRTASRIAARFQIPLHLNVNDDWPTVNHLPSGLKNWGKDIFGETYRFASSRWCASPHMAEVYETDFGVRGNVLYPLLGADQLAFDSPKTNGNKSAPCVFAYAGSIHNQAYANCMLGLASVLERTHSKLIVYSALTLEGAGRFGLIRPNIELKPLIPPNRLITTLRESADIIFVPMSFDASDLQNMMAAFPSKLPDCTAVGLPILIWGPPYCSAVRWARENHGVTALISENDPKLLSDVVTRLVNDRDYRLRLGAAALTVGNRCFSHSAVTEKFYRILVEKEDWTIPSTQQALM